MIAVAPPPIRKTLDAPSTSVAEPVNANPTGSRPNDPNASSLAPEAVGLLLQGSVPNIIFATITALVGITALTVGIGGWLLRKTNWVERIALIIAGLILIYPSANLDVVGLALFAVVLGYQWLTERRLQPA